MFGSDTSGTLIVNGKCDAFDAGRIYSEEKYSLNNMLMRQDRYPFGRLNPGDQMITVWSDRPETSARFNDACEKHFAEQPGNFESGARFSDLSPDEFIAWAKEASGTDKEVVGVQLVRFTDDRSQFPVYRLNLYVPIRTHVLPQLHSGNFAPNVVHPERRLTALERMHEFKDGHANWGFN